MAQAASRNVSSRTLAESPDDTVSRRSPSIGRESWEDEAFERDGAPQVVSLSTLLTVPPVKSSLPVVRHAVHNERVAADNRMDRMAIWMRNVERMLCLVRMNSRWLMFCEFCRGRRRSSAKLCLILERSHTTASAATSSPFSRWFSLSCRISGK